MKWKRYGQKTFHGKCFPVLTKNIHTQKKERRYSPNINKNYCFENFIEGSNNEFAKNASISVSSKPGKSNFNPLIIYGGVGLGKTHLLHAIGNQVLENNPLVVTEIISKKNLQ